MSNRLHNQQSIAFLLCVAALSGCTAEVHRHIRFPDFLQPGWANEQRRDAIRHDPYPLNDLGPEVVGGRPREYQQPVNEVERARMYAPRPVAAQVAPVSPWPVAPSPTSAPPPVIITPYPAAPVRVPPFQLQQRTPY
jgi:hypothetical protein